MALKVTPRAAPTKGHRLRKLSLCLYRTARREQRLRDRRSGADHKICHAPPLTPGETQIQKFATCRMAAKTVDCDGTKSPPKHFLSIPTGTRRTGNGKGFHPRNRGCHYVGCRGQLR